MFIIARDKSFNKVAYDVPYTSLMWVTRWYDFGEFLMQVPIESYSKDWRYISSPDSDRVAMIQRIQYSSADGGVAVLSGFFLEKMLDRAVALPDYRYNGKTTAVMYACYDLIRKYYTDDVNGLLDIDPTYYNHDGSPKTTRQWTGNLGTVIYDALMSFGMSQHVRLIEHYELETISDWVVLIGKNRSEGQTEYSPVVLSSAYNDFLEYDFVFDDSCYKNTAVVTWGNIYQSQKVHRTGETIAKGMESQIYVESSATENEENTYDEVKAEAAQEGREALGNYTKVEDLNVTLADPSIVGSLFDLGDIITVKIPEAGIAANIRAVEITETFDIYGKSVEVGFGNKRISNIRRATA